LRRVKSGSPAPRSTTSAPAARIASAACIAASVADAFIMKHFGNLKIRRVLKLPRWNEPAVELILLAHPAVLHHGTGHRFAPQVKDLFDESQAYE
jgi:hypothetical protein